MGELLPCLQFGDARICEVFFGCGRLTVEGNKQKKRKEQTKALYLTLVCSNARCAKDWARDTWEMTVITYPQVRPRAALGVSHTHTPLICTGLALGVRQDSPKPGRCQHVGS